MYTRLRLDYRLRLWAPTFASRTISAVAELLVLFYIFSDFRHSIMSRGSAILYAGHCNVYTHSTGHVGLLVLHRTPCCFPIATVSNDGDDDDTKSETVQLARAFENQ